MQIRLEHGGFTRLGKVPFLRRAKKGANVFLSVWEHENVCRASYGSLKKRVEEKKTEREKEYCSKNDGIDIT